MTIKTDLIWGYIEYEAGELHIKSAVELTSLLKKILSPSQFNKVLLSDGTFKLSKKGEKYLMNYIADKNK